MIADLKPYAEYKESGVPWLGRVPSTWRVVRNGSLFGQRNQTGYEELPILEVSLKTGVRVRDFENSTRKQVMSDMGKYKRAAKGDVAYNMMRMWQGAVGVSPVDGLVSPAYVVARPYPQVESRFFVALFRTGDYMSEIDNCSRGIVKDRNRLYWDQFKQILSPCPPPAEQAAIVRFLDWANGRLERAIRAKRKVIALLNEQKQAIIHRAVTRGLDPSVPLKPSRIPWLGDIPQHWEVRRVASFAHKVTNGWVGPTREILTDSGVPYLQSLHVKKGEIRFKKQYFVDEQWLGRREKIRLHAGDVVVVQTGDVGQVAHIPVEFDGAGCHALIIIGTNLSVIGGSYLSRVLNCWYGQVALRLIETGALLPHLNCGHVRDVQIPVPPLLEQLEIEKHLSSMLEPVSAAISRLEREIELLREYRTRLVADVVTGKLDVREAAARLPDEAELDTIGDDIDLSDEIEPADEKATA